MQYEVPQFIEVEDKIFGPLTLKQFIYLAGGAALSFLIYKLASQFIPSFIALIFVIPLVAFSLALAFYKPDGHRPFIVMVEQAFKYFFGVKLYIWKKTPKNIEVKKEDEKTDDVANMYIPKLSDSKLKELTWSLDIHEKVRK